MKLNRKTAPELGAINKLNAPEPEKRTLSNGIPVYIIDSGDQDIIRVDFTFQAGSKFQDKIFQSYFANALLADGTKKKSSRQIADELDFYGSYLNPGSDRDEAGIQIFSLSKFLSPTLDLAAGMLNGASFPEEEIEILKGKRHQSLTIENKKVEHRAKKRFFRTLFGEDHPYGQVGDPEDLEGISRPDILAFYNKYYHPGNCNIIIAGRMAAGYFQMLEDKFGQWEAGENRQGANPKATYEVYNKPMRKIRENVPGAVQAAIRIGCIAPVRNHPDFAGLSIANTVLGGYFGSRLMQNIREDKGYTYGIGSSLFSFGEAGVFLIGTDVGTEYYEQTLKECYHELDVMASSDIGNEEFERVKRHIQGDLLRQLDGPYNLAESLKSLLPFGLDFDYLKVYLDVLNNIGPGEIRRLSEQYMNPENFLEVVAGVDENQ